MGPKKLYNQQWEALKRDPRGFELFQEPLFESGDHPRNFVDHECAFASFHIRRVNPAKILDIGSYRHFILGLLAHYSVTAVDVRPRNPAVENEATVTCDAKNLTLPDDSLDLVVSLCSLEHFGLGRNWDEFDPAADRKAFTEVVRVLRTGGSLILTTTITRAAPSIAFNAHRIYSYEQIIGYFNELHLEQFALVDDKHQFEIDADPVYANRQEYGCGCW